MPGDTTSVFTLVGAFSPLTFFPPQLHSIMTVNSPKTLLFIVFFAVLGAKVVEISLKAMFY